MENEKQKQVVIQTYGKRNKMLQEIDNIKYALKPSKVTIQYLERVGIQVYQPKLKTYKKVGLIAGIITCISTPGTNLAIPFIVRWAFK